MDWTSRKPFRQSFATVSRFRVLVAQCNVDRTGHLYLFEAATLEQCCPKPTNLLLMVYVIVNECTISTIYSHLLQLSLRHALHPALSAAELGQPLSLQPLLLDLLQLLLLQRVPLLGLGSSHTLLVRAVLVVRAEQVVPPSERSRIVVHERHVVEIMVICATPERDDVLQRPGEIVPAVRVDRLEETQGDPDVDAEDVQVGPEEAVEQRSSDGAGAEDEDFEWVGVFGCEAEGRGVFVVHLVDVLVERACTTKGVTRKT